MKTIGIIQPNYIPWRGYFDFIRQVDIFVFLDDVQFNRRDWRSRNRIKLGDGGCRWLTVPVLGGRDQRIVDVRIDNSQDWARRHFEALRHSYGKSPGFEAFRGVIENLYEPGRFVHLADLNVAFTRQICDWLGMAPEFVNSSDLYVEGKKDDRLLSIVRKLGGDEYLSGPAATDYIRPELWAEAGIGLRYMDYSGYPTYAQVSDPFEPSVTVLDLLFMKAGEAPEYIWGRYRQK